MPFNNLELSWFLRTLQWRLPTPELPSWLHPQSSAPTAFSQVSLVVCTLHTKSESLCFCKVNVSQMLIVTEEIFDYQTIQKGKPTVKDSFFSTGRL